jgi:hypothetical protein
MDSPYNKIAIIGREKKTLSSQVFQLISSLFMSSTLRNFKWSTLVNRGRFLKQSAKKESILELEVPEKETGIFFYDSHWRVIMGDHT